MINHHDDIDIGDAVVFKSAHGWYSGIVIDTTDASRHGKFLDIHFLSVPRAWTRIQKEDRLYRHYANYDNPSPDWVFFTKHGILQGRLIK